MELVTITDVTKSFNITTRTLRYYEEIGLINSQSKEGYAYRVYDEKALKRLQQILILKKLQIPLKQIRLILEKEDLQNAIRIFQANIDEISNKMDALSTVRTALKTLITELDSYNQPIGLELLNDDYILGLMDLPKIDTLRKNTLENLSNINTAIKPLQMLKNVRIIHIPPCTVASSHYIGEDPEQHAGDMINDFIQSSNLYNIKPDSRAFGFNHPSPSPDRKNYGYEQWVTIPEDMDVPEPLKKKTFKGGLYAAHSIILGNFHEWEWLWNWVHVDNPKYEANTIDDDGETMQGLLEEGLNFVYNASNNWPVSDENQIDLLLPIKLKK